MRSLLSYYHISNFRIPFSVRVKVRVRLRVRVWVVQAQVQVRVRVLVKVRITWQALLSGTWKLPQAVARHKFPYRKRYTGLCRCSI